VVDVLASAMANSDGIKSQRKFDTIVLCLAFLVAVVDMDEKTRVGFMHIAPSPPTINREYGAVALILELLQVTWNNFEGYSTNNLTKEDGMMERKVITGYLCLLLGALSVNATGNRKVIRTALPNQSLLGLVTVINEFLDFHHDAGVKTFDDMYHRIIDGLTNEERLAIEEDKNNTRIADAAVNSSHSVQ